MTQAKDLGNTATGIKTHVAGMLCYLLGFITGIIFYLIEDKNKFVRFHALQSIITFGGLFVIGLVVRYLPGIGGFLVQLICLLNLILWVVLMVKAYRGETYKLPWVGDIAEKNLSKKFL
jgi:uncharacterized membrane protein